MAPWTPAGPAHTVGDVRVRVSRRGRLLEREPRALGRAISQIERETALHRRCLRVDDLERAMAALAGLGVRWLDHPQAGAHGSRVAFVHPSRAGGLLVELKEEPS